MTGQFEDAIDSYQQSLSVHAQVANTAGSAGSGAAAGLGPGAAECIACIGDALLARGSMEGAVGAYQCAEAVAIQRLGAAHATVVFLGSKVAHCLFLMGHTDASTAL